MTAALTARQADHAALVGLINACLANDQPRRVVLLRLDRLPAAMLRPHHLRLLTGCVDPLAVADRARRFRLAGGAIAIAWRGGAVAALAQARADLARLLEDAPPDAPTLDALLTVYDLPGDGAALLAAIAEPVAAAEAAEGGAPALDHDDVAALERRLHDADVARFVRRRPCCRRDRGGFPLAWEMRGLALDEIVAGLLPDRAAAGDAWLLQRLDRTLERRLLTLLAAPGELSGAPPFAVRLTARGILSPAFQRLDAVLPVGLRGAVRLAIPFGELLADPATVRLAREFARARAYPVMVADATEAGLAMVDIGWLDPEHVALAAPSALPAGIDPATIVQTGTDTDAALAAGIALGITLFTGAAIRPG